jgi:hypothetical protein
LYTKMSWLLTAKNIPKLINIVFVSCYGKPAFGFRP